MANNAPGQLLPFLGQISRGRNFLILVVLLLSIVLFGSLIYWNTRPEYQVLFSSLSPEDASEMANRLKEKKIPFRLVHSGTTLMVPEEQVYDLRLSMTAEGLPKGGGVGFEVFDRNSLGVTDFVQKLNYQRALQGELGRTIKQIREVEQVRVHITTPRESLFVEEQKKPTASIFIKTRGGAVLNPSQIEGIVHLVASAVEGLEPGNISIVDTSGKVLSKAGSHTPVGQLTTTQLEHQNQIEESLRKKVQGMLEEVLGPGKAIVRISTVIDFQQVIVTEEKFDPNTVLRSEQKNVERPSPEMKSAGVKSESSSESKAAASFQPFNPLERQNEIRNYEVSKVNRQIRGSVGGVKKVSAAVVIDGVYKEEVDAKGNKDRKYIERPQEEMNRLESIVKKAIGFDEERGDQVEVINLPFYGSAVEEEVKTEEKTSYREYLPVVYKPAISLALTLLFILFVLRPILKRRPIHSGQEVPLLQVPAPTGILAETPPEPSVVPALNPKDHALQLVQKDPSKAVGVMRSWLHEKE